MAENQIQDEPGITTEPQLNTTHKDLSPQPLKRRASSPSSPSSKRTRLNDSGSPPPRKNAQPEKDVRPTERRKTAEMDKSRGQRLFGGVLGALAQKPDNKLQAKKRAEIEARQVERARLQKERDEQLRVANKEKLEKGRAVAQISVNKQTMRIRHDVLLDQAHSLSTSATNTSPKIFWKPYHLLPSQEETIKLQISTAKATISSEVLDYERRHSDDTREFAKEEQEITADFKPQLGGSSSETGTKDENAVKAEDANLETVETAFGESKTETVASGASVVRADDGDDGSLRDDGGEVVMEDGEDTVIY